MKTFALAALLTLAGSAPGQQPIQRPPQPGEQPQAAPATPALQAPQARARRNLLPTLTGRVRGVRGGLDDGGTRLNIVDAFGQQWQVQADAATPVYEMTERARGKAQADAERDLKKVNISSIRPGMEVHVQCVFRNGQLVAKQVRIEPQATPAREER